MPRRIGNGPGWGGGAKGEGTGGAARGDAITDTRKPFRSEDGSARQAGLNSIPARERSMRIREMLADIAEDPEQPGMTRVRAGEAYLDRVEGKPVQRTINANADDLSELDDDALGRRREALERAIGADAGGTAAPLDPA